MWKSKSKWWLAPEGESTTLAFIICERCSTTICIVQNKVNLKKLDGGKKDPHITRLCNLSLCPDCLIVYDDLIKEYDTKLRHLFIDPVLRAKIDNVVDEHLKSKMLGGIPLFAEFPYQLPHIMPFYLSNPISTYDRP